jgi:predicted phage terminase large subunit-like protein
VIDEARKILAGYAKIDVSKVPDQLLTAMLHTLETARGAESFLDFFQRITPEFEGFPTLRPTHLRPVADIFHRVAMRQSVRACISMPPRSAKTEFLLHSGAKVLAMNPSWPMIYTSATAEFARGNAKKFMEYFQAAGGKVKRGQALAHAWKTTSDGGLYSVGLGGQVVGRGAMLLMIDDFTKSRVEAESAAHREKAWAMFRGSLMTRVHPGGSVIVIQTRWHRSDLIGRIENELDGWEIINLPAIADEHTPGREPGSLLWPEFWTSKGLDPVNALRVLKETIGDYEWSAQYQGRPTPKGRELFGEPTYITQDGFDADRSKSWTFVACDPAATAKTSSDYSAIICGIGHIDPVTRTPIVNIGDVIRQRFTPNQLVNMLIRQGRIWNAPIAVEAQGGFAMIPDMLRRIDPKVRVIPITTYKDKFTRALPVAAAWQNGRIRLLENQEWEKDFLDEVQQFTGVSDPHDDQVDALGYFYTGIADYLKPTILPKQMDGVSPITPFG